MDPVTTAIIAAIAAGITKVGEQAISDSYDALKKLLKEKFGKKSQVVKAVKQLEEKPVSDGRKTMLQEEIVDAKADKDKEILKAAQELLDLLKSQPGGGQFIQKATGNYIAQAGPGATATVNVNKPKGK
jgi:hypothetical protein